jgi:hypothetical protein
MGEIMWKVMLRPLFQQSVTPSTGSVQGYTHNLYKKSVISARITGIAGLSIPSLKTLFSGGEPLYFRELHLGAAQAVLRR